MSGFMFSRVLIVISLLGLFFTQPSFGQKGTSSSSPQLSFGAVDINLIVEQMPEAKEADAKLKEMQKQLQDTIMKMQDALQKKVDSYLKQKKHYARRPATKARAGSPRRTTKDAAILQRKTFGNPKQTRRIP